MGNNNLIVYGVSFCFDLGVLYYRIFFNFIELTQHIKRNIYTLFY